MKWKSFGLRRRWRSRRIEDYAPVNGQWRAPTLSLPLGWIYIQFMICICMIRVWMYFFYFAFTQLCNARTYCSQIKCLYVYARIKCIYLRRRYGFMGHSLQNQKQKFCSCWIPKSCPRFSIDTQTWRKSSPCWQSKRNKKNQLMLKTYAIMELEQC